jgi:hypothetical protein
MNYERIELIAKEEPKYNFNFTMITHPNAKNYSNCDINGSFYEVTEHAPATENKSDTTQTNQ